MTIEERLNKLEDIVKDMADYNLDISLYRRTDISTEQRFEMLRRELSAVRNHATLLTNLFNRLDRSVNNLEDSVACIESNMESE